MIVLDSVMAAVLLGLVVHALHHDGLEWTFPGLVGIFGFIVETARVIIGVLPS